MALVAIPDGITVTSLRIRRGGGQNVVQSAVTNETYTVQSGVTKYRGTVTLQPNNEAQDNALLQFHLALNGDDNEVMLPLYRNADAQGIVTARRFSEYGFVTSTISQYVTTHRINIQVRKAVFNFGVWVAQQA